jgi:hypothetical protein
MNRQWSQRWVKTPLRSLRGTVLSAESVEEDGLRGAIEHYVQDESPALRARVLAELKQWEEASAIRQTRSRMPRPGVRRAPRRRAPRRAASRVARAGPDECPPPEPPRRSCPAKRGAA